MNAELQNPLSRPRRYDKNDGTAEMATGIMAIGFSLLGSLLAILPQNSIWRHGFANALLFFGGVLLMVGLMQWVPRAIKRRITWPRTGYVAYNRVGATAKSKKVFWIVMVVFVVFSAAMGAGGAYLRRLPDLGSSGPHGVVLGGRQDWINIEWIGVAPLYVAIYGWLFCRDRNYPWRWLVLLFMAVELIAIAVVAPGDFAATGQLMLLVTGLTWIGSGGVTLYLFVRHTQQPTEAIE